MIVSYAQNAEDVVLSRLFDSYTGFYVDVGAGDPVLDSITKTLFDRGWSGINVEPQKTLFQKLSAERPRDRNFNCAIGATTGWTNLTEYPDHWGWATTSRSVSNHHRRNGVPHRTTRVQVRTLTEILEEVQPSRIDLLNIDVEGSEAEVVPSVDWKYWAPRTVVVEAMAPGDGTPSYCSWEPALLSADYRLALFDGLNRFYVRDGDAEALQALSIPANELDNFVPNKWLRLMEPDIRLKLLKRQFGQGDNIDADIAATP